MLRKLSKNSSSIQLIFVSEYKKLMLCSDQTLKEVNVTTVQTLDKMLRLGESVLQNTI